MTTITDLRNTLKGLYMVEEKEETWKFLYTRFKSIKQATTKTGALKEGTFSKASFIITTGKDYADCLQKAKQECKFTDSQLLGSLKQK